MEYESHTHEFPAFFRADSTILILGSFPSVKSRAAAFYYGHPQNRFWGVMAEIFGEKKPETQSEKEEFLVRNKIALWDAIESCEIKGSSDASIRNVVPTDIPALLAKTNITRIFTNGKLADRYYRKYNEQRTGITAICLPSTSPANAAVKRDQLVAIWGKAIRANGSTDRKLVRLHLTFTGRVQHVGFRAEAFDIARRLGLTGWVRNCWQSDRTEAEVQGDEWKVREFIGQIRDVKRFAVQYVAEYTCAIKPDEDCFSIW